MESSDEEVELGEIVDAIVAYAAKCWSLGKCPKRERYLTHRESVGSPHFRLPALDPYGKRKGRRVWEQAPFPDLPSVRKRAGQIQSSSDSVARPRHLSDSAPG